MSHKFNCVLFFYFGEFLLLNLQLVFGIVVLLATNWYWIRDLLFSRCPLNPIKCGWQFRGRFWKDKKKIKRNKFQNEIKAKCVTKWAVSEIPKKKFFFLLIKEICSKYKRILEFYQFTHIHKKVLSLFKIIFAISLYLNKSLKKNRIAIGWNERIFPQNHLNWPLVPKVLIIIRLMSQCRSPF